MPDILAELAEVEMHAIQTSGNCIRNVTADHFAGAAADEVADPRPYAEILRQWSSLHPEFSLPAAQVQDRGDRRAERDRAAIQVHDIGLHVKRNEAGELGFAVYVGGGQGRTPMIAKKIRDFLPEADLLAYLRGDPARLQSARPARQQVQGAHQDPRPRDRRRGDHARRSRREFAAIDESELKLPRRREIARIERLFRAASRSSTRPTATPAFERARETDPRASRAGVAQQCARRTSMPGYAIVTISLKPIGGTPGDATSEQMDAVADLAERYSFDEVRVSHEQNLVLPHVALDDLPAVYDAAARGRARHGQCRPGHRHHRLPGPRLLRARQCALDPDRAAHLASASPIAERQSEIGELKIKISGCINACGHHHVGHIGILGVEKQGRGVLPDHARRLGRRDTARSARSSATASPPKA